MRVLVVDDDVVCQLTVEAMVRALGHECLTAFDGRLAWDVLRNEPVDVLITDREMPYVDGLALCRRVRTEPTTRHVYVILATAHGSPGQAREGILAGADDYLVKPTLLSDLELRLMSAERLRDVHRADVLINQELRNVARRDPLTGLGNRRRLSEDLVVMAEGTRRYGHGFSIALLDIDNFKEYNDRYGHLQGDEALKAVAKALPMMSRMGDRYYRYGGEEFVCIYPGQSAIGAKAVVERLSANVAKLTGAGEGLGGGLLTLSAGIAEMNADRPDAEEAVRAADLAMYAAKKLGRNRVEIAALQTRVHQWRR